MYFMTKTFIFSNGNFLVGGGGEFFSFKTGFPGGLVRVFVTLTNITYLLT